MDQIKLFDPSLPNQIVRESFFKLFESIYDRGLFIGGDAVSQFEHVFANYIGTRFAVSVASGTDAITLALKANGIGCGDAVVTSPFTFFASAGAIALAGAQPVFTDIDPKNYCIDPVLLEDLLHNDTTGRIKAVVYVHLFGNPGNIAAVRQVCAKADLLLIEDCAQALGASFQYGGREVKVGAAGKCGCFSFYPTKILGGIGDGGMITTNDEAVFEKLLLLKNHGASARDRYTHEIVGCNSRLDAANAIYLLQALSHVEQFIADRRLQAQRYDGLLSHYAGVTPSANVSPVHNVYTIRLKDRNMIEQILKQNNIQSAIYYKTPLNKMRAFSHLPDYNIKFSEADKAASEVLSLPIYPGLTAAQQNRVVETIINNIL